MAKIFVAGNRGMVGSAICRQLGITDNEIVIAGRDELDLTNQAAVKHFFETERPDQVYLAAAKVGGIYANNTYPADFIYQNLMIQNNIIHSSFVNGIKNIIFLGSSCIYPKKANQIQQTYMLSLQFKHISTHFKYTSGSRTLEGAKNFRH